jgi:hypothetical protein
MPLEPFNGTTFVAFTDISGFKDMMGDERRAVRALDRFYQAGYDALHRQHGVPRVDGLFVSDSGILFVRGTEHEPAARLRTLLEAVEAINRAVLSSEVMLTTSIAHGAFSYHDRLEFLGIEKNPIYGNAYVAALLDNERGKPKIQPGECRIILQQPGQVEDALRALDCPRLRRASGAKHAYFFWMVSQGNQIVEFERLYRDAYSLKYKGMLEALRSAANFSVPRSGEE